MASLVVFKIKKVGSSSWLNLPTPITMKPALNALDNSKSGRDNNKGNMFRDKIAEKLKYSVEMPDGLTNKEVAAISQILMETQFTAFVPDVKSGMFKEKSFYCSSVEPEIEQIYSLTYWTYKSWSFSAVEM